MIALGRTSEGTLFAGYRISSRSFPDRRAYIERNAIYVSPSNLEDLKTHPHIFYPCLKIAGEHAVLANGEHSETIANNLALGEKPFNAVAIALSEAGPEEDAYKTPRIAGILSARKCIIGIVQITGLSIREFKPDQALTVATYEKTSFEAVMIKGRSAGEIARNLYGLGFELPVCAACAVSKEKAFELDVYNGRVSGE